MKMKRKTVKLMLVFDVETTLSADDAKSTFVGAVAAEVMRQGNINPASVWAADWLAATLGASQVLAVGDGKP